MRKILLTLALVGSFVAPAFSQGHNYVNGPKGFPWHLAFRIYEIGD